MHKPDLIIPFEINREQAAQIFLRRFSADKMAPSEFAEAVHHDRFERRFMSAYLFDCNVITSVSAECTKRHDDKIDTYSSERTVSTQFSETLLNADDMADDFLLRMLEPYDLEKAAAFSKDLLGDTDYGISRQTADEIFEAAKPELERNALEAAEKAFRGFTDRKTTGCTHSFADKAYKHLLLPVWVLDCTCYGQNYRIFLNGQTGRVVGIPPRSRKKAAAIIGIAAIVGAAAAQILWTAVTLLW